MFDGYLQSLLHPWVIATILVVAAFFGFLGSLLTMLWYRHSFVPKALKARAMLLRKKLLRSFPPGDRPELRFVACDDQGQEEWEWLEAHGYAYETAQGWRLNEWGPEESPA